MSSAGIFREIGLAFGETPNRLRYVWGGAPDPGVPRGICAVRIPTCPYPIHALACLSPSLRSHDNPCPYVRTIFLVEKPAKPSMSVPRHSSSPPPSLLPSPFRTPSPNHPSSLSKPAPKAHCSISLIDPIFFFSWYLLLNRHSLFLWRKKKRGI